MKKILLFLLIFICNLHFCLADEQIIEDIDGYFVDETEQNAELHGYLEYNNDAELQEAEEDIIRLEAPIVRNSVNLAKPGTIEPKSLFSSSKAPEFNPIEDNYFEAASGFSSQEYTIKPVSTVYSKKLGKFSFGTMYDSALYSAQVNYSTGMFAKYESKFFALGAGFSKSTGSNYSSYNDRFYFMPELKLTQRLSVLDVMQTDVSQINKSNKIVLRYSPDLKKYADDVKFELGVAQSFYQNTYVKSSLSFSTIFKL